MTRGALRVVYLVRHGETEWSLSRRATGLTDISLTRKGAADARRLASSLHSRRFSIVLSSPSARAMNTAQLAGFRDSVQTNANLHEWDYGDYEGMTTREIQALRLDWNLFRDGCPAGETLLQVGTRADEVIAKLRLSEGDAIVFAHRDILRIIAARWIGLRPFDGQRLQLDPCSVSILGYGHTLEEPMIRQWNTRLLSLAGD